MTADPDTGAGAGPERGTVFAFFNEIGIIAQLSQALLGKVLPDGVHPSHFAIMNHLVRLGDGKPPVRIASAMQVTKATMTHSLAVLERRGLIETRPSAEDARSKLVYLTVAGRSFHAEAIAGANRAFGRIVGEPELQTMRECIPALVEIRKLLDENRDPGE
ncbi:MAG: MarR family transcriptional regulator [Hoeflea sp.]|uniref:MarR family winged helix-turn-helix transcriptional regulator n=1 Tax=Hoeflea sp. TaxID=1940281 RepID=UPI0032EF81B9